MAGWLLSLLSTADSQSPATRFAGRDPEVPSIPSAQQYQTPVASLLIDGEPIGEQDLSTRPILQQGAVKMGQGFGSYTKKLEGKLPGLSVTSWPSLEPGLLGMLDWKAFLLGLPFRPNPEPLIAAPRPCPLGGSLFVGL